MSWSREQCEILIEEYQKHPCLYVVKSSLYKNRNARQASLEKIQRVLQPLKPTVEIREIKAKLNGLRTNFVSEYRKYANSKQSGMSEEDVYQPTIWYFNKMLFLRDHIQVRLGFDTLDDSQGDGALGEGFDRSQHESDHDYFVADDGVLEPAESIPGPSHHTSVEFTPAKRRKQTSESISVSGNEFLETASNTLTQISTAVSGGLTQESEDVFGCFVASKLKDMRARPDIRLEVEEDISKTLFAALRKMSL